MTALNVVLLDDAALIVTETRAVQPLGAACDVAKTLTLPHMRLAVAVQGKQAMATSLARILSMKAADFDSARLALRVGLKDFAATQFGDLSERDAWASDWSMLVAGWSVATNGPAAVFAANHSKHGTMAWEVVDVKYLLASPFIPEAVEAAGHDPHTKMLDLLRAQARHDPRGIGGYAVATYIGQGEISQGCLGRIDASNWKAPMAA